jgi:hypothetical protein
VQLPKKEALIVDDDVHVRELVLVFYRRQGLQVTAGRDCRTPIVAIRWALSALLSQICMAER